MPKTKRLTNQQAIVVKNMARGLNVSDSMRLAGYAQSSINTYSSTLLRKIRVQKALAKAGLTEDSTARILATNITSGVGVKSTADTSIRGLELYHRLVGNLDKDKEDAGNTTNVYIKELKMLSDDQLRDRLEAVEGEVVTAKQGK